MKTIVVDSTVQLDEILSISQPIVLSTLAFKGKRRIALNICHKKGVKIVCFSKGKKEVRPYFLNSLQEMRKSFLLILKEDGEYRVLFCLSHRNISASLHPEKEGCELVLQGDLTKTTPVLVCVHGSSLYQSIKFAVRIGIKLVSNTGKLKEEKPPLHYWLGSLGWESGGSFGVTPTHDKIVNAVWGLRQEGIQPGYVLIDEGWQHTKNQEGQEVLLSFEADPERFPMGLTALVQELQRAGVHHVGVAHSILGGRGGVSDQLANSYQLSSSKNRKESLGFDLGKTFQFYNDYYQYLSEQGIAFAKVKNQTEVERSADDSIKLGELFNCLQSAIQASSSLHFSAPHLNSECICNENIFYWNTSRIACTADDLDTQSLEGAKKAIRNILSNSLWMQYLMYPDFNAWTTYFPHSYLLAVLHALSGTINVISDPPGKSHVELLKKCVLPSGKLIQADHPLTLCSESAFFNPLTENALYRGFSFKGEVGILALFHLARSRKLLQENVCAIEIDGIVGDRFAVYSHINGFLGVYRREDRFPITIKKNEADILTFSPVRRGVALLGCYAFFVPPGPIQEITFEEDSMHIISIVTSPIILYSERRVMDVRRNGETIPWDYDETKKILVIDSRQTQREITTIYTINFE